MFTRKNQNTIYSSTTSIIYIYSLNNRHIFGGVSAESESGGTQKKAGFLVFWS